MRATVTQYYAQHTNSLAVATFQPTCQHDDPPQLSAHSRSYNTRDTVAHETSQTLVVLTSHPLTHLDLSFIGTNDYDSIRYETLTPASKDLLALPPAYTLDKHIEEAHLP